MSPLLWLLTGRRHGDNAQLRALAADLRWLAREVALSHNALCQLPNAVLGASLASLARRPEDLQPPWPDIVVGIGRRSVPAARWIAARGGARLVWLGRPRARTGLFDLVLTTPQYAMPETPGVVRLSLPWQAPMAQAPARGRGAHVMAVLGGPSWSAAPTLASVDALIVRAAARAAALDLPLVATTSPRTPAALAERLRTRLPGGARLRGWGSQGGGSYREDIAAAAEIVLTGDSVSTLADAAWTGRPVTVIAVPAPGWLAAVDRAGPLAAAWRRRGGNLGLAAPPPDLAAVQARLAALGLVRPLGDGDWQLAPCRPILEAERRDALSRIEALPG